MVQACANEAEINLALQAGFRADLLVMDLRIDGALQGLDITRRVRALQSTTACHHDHG